MFYFGNVYKHTLIVLFPRKMSERRIRYLCTLPRTAFFPVSSGKIVPTASDSRQSFRFGIVVS